MADGRLEEEQDTDPKGMFTRWWNWLVDEHAEAEGKTVKKYRIVKGEYVDADEGGYYGGPNCDCDMRGEQDE